MSRRGDDAPFSLFAFQDIITSVSGIMILITLLLALELIVREVNAPPAQTADVTEQLEQAITGNYEKIAEMEAQATINDERLAAGSQMTKGDLERQMAELREAQLRLDAELTRLDGDLSRRERNLEDLQEDLPEGTTVNDLIEQATAAQEALKEIQASDRVFFVKSDASDSTTAWLVEISGNRILVAQLGVEAPPQQFANEREFLNWAAARNRQTERFLLLLKPDGVERFWNINPALTEGRFTVGYTLLAESQTGIDPEKGSAF